MLNGIIYAILVIFHNNKCHSNSVSDFALYIFTLQPSNWLSIPNSIHRIIPAYQISPDLTAHRESSAAICLLLVHRVAPCDWHVIKDPMMLVIQRHPHFQEVQLLIRLWLRSFVCLHAHHFTIHIVHKVQLVWTGPDSLSEYHLPKILDWWHCFIAQAKIKVVILKWYHWFFSVKSVYVQWHFIL